MENNTALDRRPVHLVVTCANRKRFAPPPELTARELGGGDVETRCRRWIELLAADAPASPAADMYAGEYWQVAKKLGESAGARTKLWVCSAGYGLVPGEAMVAAYAATFALGQPDSVASNTSEARRWWETLAEWTGPADGQPRTFTQLAARHPDAIIIAVMSDAYLRPCTEDLEKAAKELADGDGFTIIGPGGRHPGIDDYVVPVTAAVQPALGGSLLSLHARAAKKVIETARERERDLTRSSLADLMAELHATAPPVAARAAGDRLTDDQVRAFVRVEAARSAGPVSATRLLRRLRESGQSCEQARFKTLFNEAMRAKDQGGLF